MRVYVDIGWMQKSLNETFLAALASIVQTGGAWLDLRVAIDGTDLNVAAAVTSALLTVVPENTISAYVLPASAEECTGQMDAIVRELRIRHAEALMPDVALTVRGWGGDSLPSQLPIVNWIPETAEDLIEALRVAFSIPPGRPDEEGALDNLLALMQSDGCFDAYQEIGDALIRSARLGAEQGKPRLLIDVSHINIKDHGTGIQRVVRRISEELLRTCAGRRFDEVKLVAAQGPVWSDFCHVENIGGNTGGPVLPRTGDTLLMLDAAWEAYPHLSERLDLVRRYSGRIITAVYDVIPMCQPDVVADALPPIFERWFRSAVLASDALICISKAVAEDVVTVIRQHDIPHRDGLRIGWWHLGSDMPHFYADAPSLAVRHFLHGHDKTFLMVGTVEPRKRHSVALDAMERLWEQGSNAQLMILGREGWNVADLTRRLREHPEAGKKLFWKDDVSDADITYAYRRAAALLFPSLSEGYGLPIVEAARLGLGAIASDIPVLREVGGEGTIYVPVDNPVVLAGAILKVLNGDRPDASSVRTISWGESTVQLLEILDLDRYEVLLRS